MIKPERLYPGDRVAVIAPAGPPKLKELEEGVKVLSQFSLEVECLPSVFAGDSYLAGPDCLRIKDVHDAFLNPLYKAVFCARGGYGTARIAPFIDYSLIRHHPKIFWGYSDITYLHQAIGRFAQLVTFHGPMIASDLNYENFHTETAGSIQALFTGEPICFSKERGLYPVKHGEACGTLTGGNLTLLTDGLGTPFQLDTTGAILFIEEVAEPPYRIDAMLTHLQNADKLEHVAGVVIGDIQCKKQEKKEIYDVVKDIFSCYSYPVIAGLPVGHARPNIGVPLGVQAYLSTSPCSLVIDSGVTPSSLRKQ